MFERDDLPRSFGENILSEITNFRKFNGCLILVSIVHHEDMTVFGRGVCNRELLRALLLRDFPPYLVIGAKRG